MRVRAKTGPKRRAVFSVSVRPCPCDYMIMSFTAIMSSTNPTRWLKSNIQINTISLNVASHTFAWWSLIHSWPPYSCSESFPREKDITQLHSCPPGLFHCVLSIAFTFTGWNKSRLFFFYVTKRKSVADLRSSAFHRLNPKNLASHWLTAGDVSGKRATRTSLDALN